MAESDIRKDRQPEPIMAPMGPMKDPSILAGLAQLLSRMYTPTEEPQFTGAIADPNRFSYAETPDLISRRQSASKYYVDPGQQQTEVLNLLKSLFRASDYSSSDKYKSEGYMSVPTPPWSGYDVFSTLAEKAGTAPRARKADPTWTSVGTIKSSWGEVPVYTAPPGSPGLDDSYGAYLDGAIVIPEKKGSDGRNTVAKSTLMHEFAHWVQSAATGRNIWDYFATKGMPYLNNPKETLARLYGTETAPVTGSEQAVTNAEKDLSLSDGRLQDIKNEIVDASSADRKMWYESLAVEQRKNDQLRKSLSALNGPQPYNFASLSNVARQTDMQRVLTDYFMNMSGLADPEGRNR